MNRFKIFLRSGTVLTIAAEDVYIWNKWISFTNGDNSKTDGSYVVVAQFAPDMWEGYQRLIPTEARKADKSGS